MQFIDICWGCFWVKAWGRWDFFWLLTCNRAKLATGIEQKQSRERNTLPVVFCSSFSHCYLPDGHWETRRTSLCGSRQLEVGITCLFQLFKHHWQHCKTSSEEEICFTTHLLQLCSLLSAPSEGKGRLEWNQAEKKCWHQCLSTHTHPPPAPTHYYCHDATINWTEQTRGDVKCNEKLKQPCLRGSKAWRWNSQENNSKSHV